MPVGLPHPFAQEIDATTNLFRRGVVSQRLANHHLSAVDDGVPVFVSRLGIEVAAVDRENGCGNTSAQVLQ